MREARFSLQTPTELTEGSVTVTEAAENPADSYQTRRSRALQKHFNKFEGVLKNIISLLKKNVTYFVYPGFLVFV